MSFWQTFRPSASGFLIPGAFIANIAATDLSNIGHIVLFATTIAIYAFTIIRLRKIDKYDSLDGIFSRIERYIFATGAGIPGMLIYLLIPYVLFHPNASVFMMMSIGLSAFAVLIILPEILQLGWEA